MQQTVVLVSVDTSKQGVGEYGPWTLYVFKDAGGNKYQTFKDDIGQAAMALMNQQVTVTYEIETRQGTNRQTGAAMTFNNNILSAVFPANGAAPATQQAQAPLQAAQQSQAAPQDAVAQDERQRTINRSAALARAVETVAAGIVEIKDHKLLFGIADVFVRYIEGDPALTSSAAAPQQALAAGSGASVPASEPQPTAYDPVTGAPIY